MSYTKQNFSAGQILKAEHLNHIEEGIAKVEQQIPTDDHINELIEDVLGVIEDGSY